MTEALEIASAQIRERHEVEELFVDSVVLKCEDSTLLWEVGWRRKAYESGHLILQIFPDKSIRQKIVKDG